LRAIGDDILRIAEHYLKIHAKRYGKKELRFTAAAEQSLMRHDWPGNVRELRNMLEQTVLLATEAEITPDHLTIGPGRRRDSEVAAPHDCSYGLVLGGQSTVRIADVERHLVAATLEKTDWNVSKSAKLLGLSRDMLRSRIEKYGFMRPVS
jgi:DNA-binding NtrC family response regulator